MANRGKFLGTGSARRELLVLSEHPIIVAGLRTSIKPAREIIVRDVRTVREAIAAMAKSLPDLLLLDLTPPTSLSLGLTKDLVNLAPTLSVLILSTHDESIIAERALRAGAKGYVMEQAGCANLVRAIRHVLAGHIYASPEISERLLMAYTVRPSAAASPLASLSEREFEVLQFVGQGRSNREIARCLHLSEKTVAAHRNHIRRKLALRSPAELVKFAVTLQEGSESLRSLSATPSSPNSAE